MRFVMKRKVAIEQTLIYYVLERNSRLSKRALLSVATVVYRCSIVINLLSENKSGQKPKPRRNISNITCIREKQNNKNTVCKTNDGLNLVLWLAKPLAYMKMLKIPLKWQHSVTGIQYKKKHKITQDRKLHKNIKKSTLLYDLWKGIAKNSNTGSNNMCIC